MTILYFPQISLINADHNNQLSEDLQEYFPDM